MEKPNDAAEPPNTEAPVLRPQAPSLKRAPAGGHRRATASTKLLSEPCGTTAFFWTRNTPSMRA